MKKSKEKNFNEQVRATGNTLFILIKAAYCLSCTLINLRMIKNTHKLKQHFYVNFLNFSIFAFLHNI